jgi:hypothetical protein
MLIGYFLCHVFCVSLIRQTRYYIFKYYLVTIRKGSQKRFLDRFLN